MTVALVAHGLTRASGSTPPPTITLDTVGSGAPATLGIIGWASYSANGGSPSIYDSLGNIWTKVGYHATNYDEVQLYYCINPLTSTTHAVGFTGGTTNYTTAPVAFFSGLDIAAVIIGYASNGAGGVTSIQPGLLAASAAGDLFVTMCSQDDNSNTNAFVCSGGFTITDQAHPGDGSSRNGALAYLAALSTTAINPTWSGPTSADFDSVIAVFKAAGAPPPPVTAFSSTLCMMGVG